MALDPRIEKIRKEYDLSQDDFWQIPQNKQWVCKHAALERVAAQAHVSWSDPKIIEADTANGVAVLSVCGMVEDSAGGRAEWSTGEASPKNNKNAYPWAMAEKRAKDRVILKLVGLHGLVYSEDEAEDFKAPGEFAKAEPKAKSRDVYENVTEKVREAGNKGREALRAYWTSAEFVDAFETLPADWRQILVEEKDAFLASYDKPKGFKDPNEQLDQQYAETMRAN